VLVKNNFFYLSKGFFVIVIIALDSFSPLFPRVLRSRTIESSLSSFSLLSSLLMSTYPHYEKERAIARGLFTNHSKGATATPPQELGVGWGVDCASVFCLFGQSSTAEMR